MEVDAHLICVSDTPEGMQRTHALLFAARNISDEILLQAMVALGEGERNGVGLADALSAVIAEKILRLQIPGGSQVVLPTSGVISRSLRDTTLMSEPLVASRDRLANATGAVSVMQSGLELGDRATHFAAGFFGNRKIRSVMNDSALDRYATSMASLGYRSALGVAERRPDLQIGRTVSAVVPGIIRRFRHIVRVLASFTEGERERMQEVYS